MYINEKLCKFNLASSNVGSYPLPITFMFSVKYVEIAAVVKKLFKDGQKVPRDLFVSSECYLTLRKAV